MSPSWHVRRSLQSKKWLLSFPRFARDIAGSFLEMKNPGVASSKTRSVLNQERFDLEYIYPFSREVATTEQNADMLALSSRAESSVQSGHAVFSRFSGATSNSTLILANEQLIQLVCRFMLITRPWGGGVTLIEYPSLYATAWRKRRPKGAPWG